MVPMYIKGLRVKGHTEREMELLLSFFFFKFPKNDLLEDHMPYYLMMIFLFTKKTE